MKDKLIPYIIILLIGVLLGGGLCKSCTDHFRDAGVQADTTIVYKVVKYSSLDLADKTIKLDVPKISKPELVFIPEVQTEIVYKDSIRYIVMQREHYFTKTADAEIWHSGVESRIDSLNVFTKTETRIVRDKPKKNTVSLSYDARYTDFLYTPVRLQYTRHVLSFFGVYGYMEWDLISRQQSIGIGASLDLNF